MLKKLSERIAERIVKKKPNRRAKNLAAFLANKTEIENAIQDRWSVKVIWETLHSEDRINVSYQSFNNYVNQHIKAETKGSSKNKPVPTNDVEHATLSKNKDKGFTFDAKPNKEDLI